MARQYQQIVEGDFGAGIDQQSAESRLSPGYAELIQNADALPTGSLRTRKGYQSHSGNIPFRVIKAEYKSLTDLCFTLNSGIDLSQTRSSPLVVYGKMGIEQNARGGDFTQDDGAQYYSEYYLDDKQELSVGLNVLTIPVEVHEIQNQNIWAGIGLASNTFSNSNSHLFPDSTNVNSGTFLITHQLTYAGPTIPAPKVLLFNMDATPTAGLFYSTTHSFTASVPFSIPQATHNLQNSNIMCKLWDSSGTELFPETVQLNLGTGEVQITLSTTTANVRISMHAPDVAQSTEVTVIGSTSVTFPVTSDFLFVSAYEFISGTLYEQVIPDSVSVDSATQMCTVSFATPISTNCKLFYEYAVVKTNTICVTPNVSPSAVFTDTDPQLTLWGLNHSEAYGTSREAGSGWVTHIDTYRSEAEERLICGLGGNLFADYSQAEVGSDYLLPTLYTDLRDRAASETYVGPVFNDATDSPLRSAGFIKATDAGSNYLNCSEIAYWDGSSYLSPGVVGPAGTAAQPSIRLRLSAPGRVVLGTPLDTTAVSPDIVTVEDAYSARFNGEFSLTKFDYSSVADTVFLWVTVPELDADVDAGVLLGNESDELVSGARVGVFTDRVAALSTTPPFISGDRLFSQAFEDEDIVRVSTTSGAFILMTGLLNQRRILANMLLVGERTSNIVPLRNSGGNSSVLNLVKGDMLSYPDLTRQLRVEYVNSAADKSIDGIQGFSTYALVTLSTGFDCLNLQVGQTILIRETLSFNGHWEITEIVSDTQFKINSTIQVTDSAAGFVQGKCIQVDEMLLFSDSIDNSISLSVGSRWIPIEHPTSSSDLPNEKIQRYLDSQDSNSQLPLRSGMVKDSLFLTNGQDDLMKYDGLNLTQASLPRWQAGAHISITTLGTGLISYPSYPSSDVTFSNSLTGSGTNTGLSIGDTVYTEHGVRATVLNVSSSNITLNVPVTATKLIRPYLLKYYLRLNSVDQNGAITASATLGSYDLQAELYKDSAVELRVVGLPQYGNLDSDRLEVQIYRTQADGDLFGLLDTIALDQSVGSGLFTYRDTTPDSLINTDSGDQVFRGVTGQDLQFGINGPLRAKHITSANNQLVLGNVRANQKLAMTWAKTTNTSDIQFSDLDTELLTIRRDNTDSSTSAGPDLFKYRFTTDSQNLINGSLVGVAGNLTATIISSNTILTVTTPSNLIAGEPVRFLTGGTLPPEIQAGVTYFIHSTSGPNAFKLCGAPGGPIISLTSGVSYSMTFTRKSRLLISFYSVSTDEWVYLFNKPASSREWTYVLDDLQMTTDGISVGDAVQFTTTGTLPTGLQLIQTYFVTTVGGASIKVSATPGGTPISLSGGSGTHTISFSGSQKRMDVSGLYQVAGLTYAGKGVVFLDSAVDGFTYLISEYANAIVSEGVSGEVPVYLGTDLNYGSSSELGDKPIGQAMRRLGNMINQSMRQVNIFSSAFSGFTPFVSAAYGGEQAQIGDLILEVPYHLSTTIELELPSFNSSSRIFVNGVEREPGEQVSSSVKVFQSRLLISYPNYPTVFNYSDSTGVTSSQVIDVNSADGQEITGIIPFFGESAFGAAQQSGVIVVFKTSSIYLVDISSRSIQKIESQGRGCTAPQSITVGRNGILFANDSGIYRLDKNLSVSFAGEKLGRLFATVDKSRMLSASGHADPVDNLYKFSFTPIGETEPSQAFVYGTVRESQSQNGVGSWVQYTQYPALGWANSLTERYFASTTGQVFRVRDTEDASDYRDGSESIPVVIHTRLLDFTSPLLRKYVRSVQSEYRTLYGSSTLILESAVDSSTAFTSTDLFSIASRTSTDSLVGDAPVKVHDIRSILQDKFCKYLQLAYSINQKDSPIELVSAMFEVAGTSSAGVTDAAKTRA